MQGLSPCQTSSLVGCSYLDPVVAEGCVVDEVFFAYASDITFDRRVFADALAQAQLLDPDDFAQYGLAGEHLDGLRQRFAVWRAELLAA